MADADDFTCRIDSLCQTVNKELGEVIALVESGIAPTHEQTVHLSDDLISFRTEYSELKSMAENTLDMKEEASSDDRPIAFYKDLLKRESEKRIHEKVAPAIVLLKRFLSIRSQRPTFTDALRPFQDEAVETLRLLESSEAASPSYLEEVAASNERRSLLLTAIDVDDLGSDSGLELLDEISQIYPPRVQQGVSMHEYYVLGGPCEDHANRLDDEEHTEASGGDDISIRGVASDDSQLESTVTCNNVEVGGSSTASNRSKAAYPIGKANPIGVSAFKRLLSKGPKPSGAIVFACLSRFRAMTPEQIVHITKIFLSADGDFFTSDAIEQAISYLVKKGIVEPLLQGEEDAVYCLSTNGADLAGKDGVINLLDSHARTPWPFPICDSKEMFHAKENWSGNENAVNENKVLLDYLDEFVGQGLGEISAKVLRDIHWTGSRYVVDVHEDGYNGLCPLLSSVDNVPDGVCAVVLTHDVPSSFVAPIGLTHCFVVREGHLRNIAMVLCPSEEQLQAGDDDSIIDDCSSLSSNVESEELAKTAESQKEIIDESGSEKAGIRDLSISQLEDETDESSSFSSSSQIGSIPVCREHVGTLIDQLINGKVAPDDQETCQVAWEMIRNVDLSTFPDADYSNIATALAFLESASALSNHEQSALLFSELSLALDSPLDRQVYSGAEISRAFPTFNEENEGLALSAYCLAMLRPSRAYDYELINACDGYLESYDEIFRSYPTLKPLFSELVRIHDVSPERGLSSSVIAAIGDDTARRQALVEMATTANKLLTPPTFKAKLSGMPEFSTLCFGRDHDLHSCMKVIADDEIENASYVREVLSEYCTDENSYYSIDSKRIDNEIDEAWHLATSGKTTSGLRSLAHEARKKAVESFRDRLDLMSKWLSYCDNGIEVSSIKKLRDLRDSLIRILEETENSGFQRVNRAPEVPCVALETLSYWLKGGEHPLSFKHFLRTGYVTINSIGIPIIDKSCNTIQYCEPWRQVLRHYRSVRVEYEDAARATLDERSETFDNLGQRMTIQKLPGCCIRLPEVSESDKSKAIDAADDYTTRFNDSLEIAFAYNQINEIEKESLASFAREYQDSFYSSLNFGCWRQFLDGLRKQIDDMALPQESALSLRLEKCREKSAGHSSSLLDEADRLLTTEKNLAVVEEYLNRFDSGERELEEGLGDLLRDSDTFSEFVSDAVYGPLYEWCIKFKGKPLASFGIDYVKKHCPDSWTTRQKDNSEKMLRNWPVSQRRSFSEQSTAQISTLFNCLGFRVSNVERVASCGREHYHVSFRPEKKDRESYIHPIAGFGTQLEQKKDVLVLYGNQGAAEILKTVTSERLSQNSIVLLNYPVSVAFRRDLAELSRKQQSRACSFLLIDQVLALHLAMHDQPVRLPVLLKCSLPLTYYQPFVRDVGPIADEMFCGREVELAAIMDPNGACVVYGGRQLGKTALLQRAESLFAKPDKKQYAVRVSILGIGSEKSVVQKISEAIQRNTGLPFGTPENMEDLCANILEQINVNDGFKMLLLIDEGDEFLAAISNNGFAQLRSLVDLRRETRNNFKFVLVGLHNVSRAKNATNNNGVFGQLGTPLCIKPFAPSEALRLISKPLAYLGFQVDRYPHLETILASTNYYPGILQFFGYSLVETMTSQYGTYYRAADGNPPFTLQKEQLGSIMNSADLNNSIKEKFRLSLELDKRYFMIARCIASLYFQNEGTAGQSNLLGYSIKDIKEFADELGILCLENEDARSYENLLEEMVDMGILVKPNIEGSRYRLRRFSFLNIIGNDDETILEDIVRENEE